MSNPVRRTLPDPGRTSRVDETDRAILELLREDGRMSIRALADRLHISRASAYDRIDRMRTRGVISGFTAVIDPEGYGYGLAAYIYLKIKQHSWKSVRSQIHTIPEVVHGSLVSGDFDLVLFVRTEDANALRELVLTKLHSLNEVVGTQTILVLDELPHPSEGL